MKFLLDNMLSPWIAEGLRAAGMEAIHVRDLAMSNATDTAIVALAGEENRAIISADIDFANILALRQLEKPSLILLRDIPRRREAILALLLADLPRLAEEIEQGSIISFKAGRFRVRRLPIRG